MWKVVCDETKNYLCLSFYQFFLVIGKALRHIKVRTSKTSIKLSPIRILLVCLQNFCASDDHDMKRMERK